MATIRSVFQDWNRPLDSAQAIMASHGLTPESEWKEFVRSLGIAKNSSWGKFWSEFDKITAAQPSTPATSPTAIPLAPPGTVPTSGGALAAIPGGGMESLYPPPGTPPSSPSAGNVSSTTSAPSAPPSISEILQTAGLSRLTPLGDTLAAWNPSNVADQRAYLQSRNVPLDMPVGDLWQSLGLSGNETYDQATHVLDAAGQYVSPQPSSFPQTPPIALPVGLQPQSFQAPPSPTLPSEVAIPPELTALISQLQGTFDSQQAQRDQLLSALNAGISEQQANARANQPLLDAALANINSVLTGQAMSPGLEGLVNSAFSPAEAEGQRKLRQAAEEAAAARGMSLTDSPIGQPYLEENRRFLEQMGGQRAQMGAQLRSQDAAFSQNVRAFQEGLKQQALSNQTEVLKTLGTPEQAASVLANLGLGARNAAVNQYGIQMQGALGSADQALRAALGQAATNQANSQLALTAQQQGFNQQFSQQQASIQNQLALMSALGDPFGAYSSFGSMGSNLANLPGMNAINLASALGGGQSFNTNLSGSGGSGGSTLGNLGAGALGLSSLLNVPTATAAAGATAPTLGSALWSGLSSLGSLFSGWT